MLLRRYFFISSGLSVVWKDTCSDWKPFMLCCWEGTSSSPQNCLSFVKVCVLRNIFYFVLLRRYMFSETLNLLFGTGVQICQEYHASHPVLVSRFIYFLKPRKSSFILLSRRMLTGRSDISHAIGERAGVWPQEHTHHTLVQSHVLRNIHIIPLCSHMSSGTLCVQSVGSRSPKSMPSVE